MSLWVDAYTESLDTWESTFYDETVTMYVDRIGEWQEAAPDYEVGDPADSALTVGEAATVTTAGQGSNWAFMGGEMTFIPAEAGTYTLSVGVVSGDGAVCISIFEDDDWGGSWMQQWNDDYSGYLEEVTVTLGANQVLRLAIGLWDGNNGVYVEGSFTVTVTQA